MATSTPMSTLNEFKPWTESLKPRAVMMKRVSRLVALNSQIMPPWFENMNKQRVREGKRKINSWEKLKSLMNKRFLPEIYKQDTYNRLFSLKQNNMSMGEYMREFEQLILRGDIPKSKP